MILFFVGCAASAQQVMTGAKLTSCNENVCSKLASEEIHRSTLSPNIMAFGDATFEIVPTKTPKAKPQLFRAADGYIDLEENILVLRELKDSKHKELIYNMSTNSLTYY